MWLKNSKFAYNKILNKWVNVDRWLLNHHVKVNKCCDKENCRCSCCKVLTPSPIFTGKQFILSQNDVFNCKSANVIYLFTCSDCSMQYIGQTTQPLHIRINAHRSCVKRNGSTFLYKHFNDGHSFENATVQIIDVLVPNNSFASLDVLEQFWIDTLCTAYPLGLNDRIDGHGNISKINPSCSLIYFNRPIARRRRGHGRRYKINVINEYAEHVDYYDSLIKDLKDLFISDKNKFYTQISSLSKKCINKTLLKLRHDNTPIFFTLSSFYYT